MYSLVAYSPFTKETWAFEHERYPTSPKLFWFSRLNLGNWRTGSLRSKFTDRSTAGDGCPSINSYRRGNSINRNSTTNSNSDKNSNNIITTTTTSSSGIQNQICTVHRKTIGRSSLGSSGSSVDEDEDLYEFNIYEDEHRYRPILKRTSKYGPLPVPSSPKYRGIWRIFGSHRKLHAHENPPLPTGSGVPSVVCLPADSHKAKLPRTNGSCSVKGCEGLLPESIEDHCPETDVADDFSTVKRCKSPLPGSPKDSRGDPSSDYGYSSDEGIIGVIDWDHFRLMHSRKQEKEKVHFSDPLVTHIYRHSYKSYIPKDAALITLKL